MRQFRVGVFFDVFSGQQSEWKKNLSFISGLSRVEHLELLIEYVPQKKQEVKFFKDLGQQYRLIVHAPFLDLTLLSPTKEIIKASLEKLLKAYEFAQQLGAHVFTIHAGLMPKFWSEQMVMRKLQEGLHSLRSSPDLPVCIENMPTRWSIQIPYPCTAAHIHRVAGISSLTLDIGHCIKSGIDPLPLLRHHLPVIHNIHLHDATSGKDHLPLGRGTLDVRKLLEILDDLHYDKYLTLEVLGRQAIRSSWKTLSGLFFRSENLHPSV